MRNKLLAILIIAMLSCLCLFGLTACGPAHQHLYVKKVVKPTCEYKGYTSKKCECGYELKEDYVDALPHDFGEYVSDDNATCEGNCTETAVCENCNAFDSREIANTATGHSYGNWICNSDGTHMKICSNDNSHEVIEDCSGGTATCIDKAVCDVCNGEYGDLTHVFTAYVFNNDSTCFENGTETAICNYCDEATNTREAVDSKVPHTFINYISNDDATCTTNCTETATCEYCVETDTRDIENSKEPHSFTNYVSDENATPDADGTKIGKMR